MKQERVIAILDFYRDIDKTVTMNERVIRNLEDQYYSTLGAVNSDGMPHGKGGVSNPVERVVLNIQQSVSDTIANMRRENEKLTAIKGEILSELNALNYREKAVIYGFYIDASMGTSFATRKLQPAAMPEYPKHCVGKISKAL